MVVAIDGKVTINSQFYATAQVITEVGFTLVDCSILAFEKYQPSVLLFEYQETDT